MLPNSNRPRSRALGFSLVELTVVVGIIMILAATGVPAIARYIRNYQIKGAAQQVAGELTTARGKAIMKNVNYGVSFLVLSNNTYRIVVEDVQGKGTRDTWANLLANTAQAGPLRTLPATVVFGTGCVDGATTFAGNDAGLRYTRYGAACDPGGSANSVTSEPCPTFGSGVGLANSIMNISTGGSMVCLTQDVNGDGTADIRRMVLVAAGGRVAQK